MGAASLDCAGYNVGYSIPNWKFSRKKVMYCNNRVIILSIYCYLCNSIFTHLQIQAGRSASLYVYYLLNKSTTHIRLIIHLWNVHTHTHTHTRVKYNNEKRKSFTWDCSLNERLAKGFLFMWPFDPCVTARQSYTHAWRWWYLPHSVCHVSQSTLFDLMAFSVTALHE